jgi:GT2 family glycosyltransferase
MNKIRGDKMPLVYIILLNYNEFNDTIECVKSLEKINYRNFKIIVIDNASMNNSIVYLKQSLKQCIIIEAHENLGFAHGNNIGIKYAIENGAEYVLLLNNDTLVDSYFLDNMIDSFYKYKNVGVVGSKIMYYPNKNIIWYGGGFIDWFRFLAVHFGTGEIDKGQYDFEKEVDFMTGCCMLIKKEVFRKIGFLPNEYFMYFEDVDFCVRVKNIGYKILYNPNAIIYHKVGLSGGGEGSAFSVKWNTRNRIIFMNKYKNKVSKLKFVLSNIFFYSTRLMKYIVFALKSKREMANAILDGFIEWRLYCKENKNKLGAKND